MSTNIKKKPHSAEFKFKVALEAIRGEKTTAEICQEYGIVNSQLFTWKKQLLDHGGEVFAKGHKGLKSQEQAQIDKLHATIGKLKVENDFLERVLGRSR